MIPWPFESRTEGGNQTFIFALVLDSVYLLLEMLSVRSRPAPFP